MDNYWTKSLHAGFKGIIGRVVLDGGMQIEIQFHTRESAAVGDQAHGLYCELRQLPDTEGERKTELNLKITEMWAALDAPLDSLEYTSEHERVKWRSSIFTLLLPELELKRTCALAEEQIIQIDALLEFDELQDGAHTSLLKDKISHLVTEILKAMSTQTTHAWNNPRRTTRLFAAFKTCRFLLHSFVNDSLYIETKLPMQIFLWVVYCEFFPYSIAWILQVNFMMRIIFCNHPN
jgi:hypothetical protein